MDPTDRPDSDVTLGEVNRNVNRVEKSLSEAIKGLVSRAEFEALVARVTEIESNSKSKVTNSISVVAIIVSTCVSIWAVVHG